MMTDPQHMAPPAGTDAARMSIKFLMEMMDKIHWRTGSRRGPWAACLSTLILTLEPGCKTRRLLEIMPAGTQMDYVGLTNAMANLGYFSRNLSLTMNEVEERLYPCLFVPQHAPDAPLVLLSGTKEDITYYDSATQDIQRVSRRNAVAGREGQAVVFVAFDPHRQDISRFMRKGSGTKWFSALVKRFSGTFWQILVTCLALNIFALAPPLFIMMVYDRVISPATIAALPALAIGVSMALVAEWMLRDIRAEGLAWMTARMDNLVGSKIFAHLIGLPAAMIENASVAAQVARIRTFESVRDFFSSAVFLSFLEIPFVLIAIGAMAAIAGKLILVPVLMIAAYTLLFVVMRHKIKTVIRLSAKASSARQQFVIETFEKLRSIRLNGLGTAWEEKFSSLSGKEILMNFRLAFLGTVAETIAHALTVMAAVLTVGFGVLLIWQGSMTTGALVACMILVWRILLPFYSLCTMIPRLEQLRNSIEQVNSLMDMETEVETATTHAALPSLRGDVTIDNITLRYHDGSAPVLDGLSLQLKPGKIAAVTGRNGTGKSSLLKLIKGLYRPESGNIRIDGYDIRQMEAMELRRQIAYVPQKPDFFPGTLLENIIIGNPFATMQDVENALKLADVWPETQHRLHGMMDQMRITPSLAARLSLARAYLQNAQVLLVDELPNTVMNSAAGKNLKTYIEQSRNLRTVLLVAHRTDLMQLADTIVHLRRGSKPVAGGRDAMLERLKEVA